MPKTIAAPYTLLPYQRAWQNDTSAVRVAEKSRRVGFSWNVAAERVLAASEEHGCDAWYIGYNKDMAEEFIRDCAFWARKLSTACTKPLVGQVFEGNDEDKGILTYTIRFASGYRISALSSRPNNLRGKKGRIIIDEAAFHEDLDGLLKAAMAVLMWGGKSGVDILSTHDGVGNSFNRLVNDVKSGKLPYSLHRVTIDDAIAQGLVERIYLMNSNEYNGASTDVGWRTRIFAEYGDDADEELRCIPAKSGGTYIPRAAIEAQMYDGPVHRLELDEAFALRDDGYRTATVAAWCDTLLPSLNNLPKTRHHFFGVDFGRKADRTVIVPGYLTQSLKSRFPFAVELMNVPYEQQKQILLFIVDRLPRFFKGALDATGNGAYLAEVATQKYGERHIESVSLSDKWYAEHLPKLKAAFQDGSIEIVRDADHLSDLSAFQLIEGVPKLPKTKNKSAVKGPSRHGDAGVAYALGYGASKMPLQEYGYEAIAKDPTRKPSFRKRRTGLL